MKKSIVIAGGHDVAFEPDIGYGLLNRPYYKVFPKFTFKFADRVLAVSEYAANNVRKYFNVKDVEIVYNGFDPQYYQKRSEQNDSVLMVSAINQHTRKVKGLDAYLETAKLLKNYNFILIGAFGNNTVVSSLKKMAPPNLSILDAVPHHEIIDYYSKASVYVQISYYESFGCALAEAMLCECVPVVTKRGALPEVVGDTGFYVQYNDPKATAVAIENASKSDKGKAARDRISTLFSSDKREEALVRIVEEIVNKNE